ncbi:MAG: SLBB domain-containing protein [Verrucomicrobiota bacterium]
MKNIIAYLTFGIMTLLSPFVHAQQAGTLKKGDLVIIELKTPVEDTVSVSSKYVVSDNGTVKMPMLAQEIPAVGISPATLARRIEEAYRVADIYTAPTLTAHLPEKEGTASHVIIVSGEVKVPGEWPLREGMTLMAAISRSGGFSDFAKIKAVKLIRGNRATFYDMRRIAPDGSNNPILQDNDQIIVTQ